VWFTVHLKLVQVTTEVAEHLADAAVTVQPYEKVLEDVEAAAEAGTRIWMDPSQASALAHRLLISDRAPAPRQAIRCCLLHQCKDSCFCLCAGQLCAGPGSIRGQARHQAQG
jgi:hypothetical protein